MAELALRPGYETPRELPHGECILTTMAAGGVRIDRADPRIMVSAELLAQVFGAPAAGVTLTMADGPNGTPFFDGAVLRIEGVNRTVIYRMVQYVPAVHGYVAEWPD